MKSTVKKLLIAVIAVMILTSCTFYSSKSQTEQRYCFGTLCSVTIYGRCRNSKSVFEQLWDRMNNLEQTISCNLEDSLVSKINRGLKIAPDNDTKLLLQTGEEFEKLTGGAFSVYIGSVTKLWAIGTEHARVPEKTEIANALNQRAIDLGALGKGYASDLAGKILRDNGVKSAVINFGGNICCVGSRPDGKDFIIGLQDPDAERGKYKETVSVSDLCVVTSGNYERYFEKDNVRYCHIMDGRTGYPVDNGIKAVSVIGESGLICDALSTCCYILGEEESRKLLELYPTYKVVFFR